MELLKELLKPKAMANYSFKKEAPAKTTQALFLGAIALLRQSIYDAIWAKHNNDNNNLSLIELHKNLNLNLLLK